MTEATIVRFLGLIYIALGLGALFNASLYKLLIAEYLDNSRAMFCTSVAAFTGGFLLLYFYGTRELGWAVIVPLIGAMALLKGLTGIVVPEFLGRIIRQLMQTESQLVFWGGMLTVLGFALLGVGYWIM